MFEKLKEHLNVGNPARTFKVDEADRPAIKALQLLTYKPIMYIANVDEKGFQHNPYLDMVMSIAKNENAVVVPICAAIEAEIIELNESESLEFLHELGLEEPGLNRVIRAGHQLLHLQTYFTAGVKEVRAWTITKGMTAPQAAGVIHTDFEKGFIRAEVIKYNNFIALGSEAACRDAGKLSQEGKEYVVGDGDVMHFKFNV